MCVLFLSVLLRTVIFVFSEGTGGLVGLGPVLTAAAVPLTPNLTPNFL
jgi:hypothetical protein